MKSKKLISLLCTAALTASSFAALAVTASAEDTSADPIVNLNFNSTANFVAGETADANYDGVLANGTNKGSITASILADGTAVKTLGEGQTAALTLVTGSRDKGDHGWYTDTANTLIKTGSYYSVEEKTANDSYLHMSYPIFGDFLKQGGGRWAHVDFPQTYTADNEKEYVFDFDAKFTYGISNGAEHSAANDAKTDAVLRLGTYTLSSDVKTTPNSANTIDISKAALSIGDEWVHVKVVTGTGGSKVYLNNSESYAVSNKTTKAVSGFGLYAKDGLTTETPPYDVADWKDASKPTRTPVVDIDNFKIYTQDPEVEADVTINFKNESGQSIKDPVTLSAIVGKQFNVPDVYKANIDAEGDSFYEYKEGATPIVSVATSNNVINLVFKAVEKPTITLNAVNAAGAVIAKLDEAKAMPGATATLYSKEYVKDSNDKYYQKNDSVLDSRNNPVYGKTVTGTTENQTVTVVYKPAYDVIYYMEAEDFEGASTNEENVYYSSTNYPLTGASGGLRATLLNEAGATYGPGFKTASVAEAGTYEITVAGFEAGNNGKLAKGIPISTLSSQTDDISHANKIGEVTSVGVFTSSFTADLAANGCFYVGKCSEANVTGQTNRLNAPLDYIVVKDKSLDAAPVPAVTIGDVDTTAATAALTLTNKEEFAALGITPKVTLIQAVYDGTALSDVKIWNNVEIDPATGTATATITGAATGASVFYVWDTVGGVRPLGAAKPYTAERI